MPDVIDQRADGMMIALVHDQPVLWVDLSRPRTVTVRAYDPTSDTEKTYILKVTHKGLCLV